jgi:hypothetical protein
VTQLVKYEAARSALAEARSVDEVKDIRDKAEAMRAYARMANDVQLELDAAELRVRAERRLGVMLVAEKAAGRLRPGPRISQDAGLININEIGVDRNLSSRCQQIASIPEPAFEASVARVRERITSRKGKVSLDITAVDKKERRAKRERDLGEKQSALPQQKFGVILADPEWSFEPWSRTTGMDRAADNHYPTSCTEVIAARDVPSIAADDCVLFLWATARCCRRRS